MVVNILILHKRPVPTGAGDEIDDGFADIFDFVPELLIPCHVTVPSINQILRRFGFI